MKDGTHYFMRFSVGKNPDDDIIDMPLIFKEYEYNCKGGKVKEWSLFRRIEVGDKVKYFLLPDKNRRDLIEYLEGKTIGGKLSERYPADFEAEKV